MIYDDLVATHAQLSGPLEALGALYQKVNDQISAAVAVDGAGAVTVNEAALKAAISGITPPGTSGQYELLTRGLDLGFAVSPAGQRMLPWHALTNPDLVQHLDAGAWQTLGFLPTKVAVAPADKPAAIVPAAIPGVGGAPGAGPIAGPLGPAVVGLPGILKLKTRPFAGLHAPATVSTPENIAMLAKAASAVATGPALVPPALLEPSQAASIWTLSPANMAKAVVQDAHPAADGAPPPAGSLGSTSTGQALTVDDLQSAAVCFSHLNAGWDNPFVLRVCFDADCAKAVAGIFSLGVPVLLKAAVTFVTSGFVAALGAAYGWVGLAIIVSAAYWALWIAASSHGFKNGVCMHIPMPWSFGLIGPGWCTPN